MLDVINLVAKDLPSMGVELITARDRLIDQEPLEKHEETLCKPLLFTIITLFTIIPALNVYWKA